MSQLQLDTEKLEALAPRLEALGLNAGQIPDPNSPAWSVFLEEVAQRDSMVAMELSAVPFDPEELASSELVAEQARRAQVRGGFKEKLAPYLTRKTVNGDDVPNYPLLRNILIGSGALIFLGFLFLQPPSSPSNAEEAQASGASTEAEPQSAENKVSGINPPGADIPRNPAFEDMVAQKAVSASAAATSASGAQTKDEPEATITPEEPAIPTSQTTPVVYPETQVYAAPAPAESLTPVVTSSQPQQQELSPEDRAALEALLTSSQGQGQPSSPEPQEQGSEKKAGAAANPGAAASPASPDQVVLLPAGELPAASTPVLSAGGAGQAAPSYRLSASSGAAGASASGQGTMKLSIDNVLSLQHFVLYAQ